MKKNHTEGKNVVKPSALKIARLLFGQEAAKRVDNICLSDDSIKRRIDGMLMDVEEQVVKELKESAYPFSLQLDESTDVASCSQLMSFVR